MAFRRREPETLMTTSRSTSLSGRAAPQAWDPNRMTRSGSKRDTMRFTMHRLAFSTPWGLRESVAPSPCPTAAGGFASSTERW